MKCNNKYQIFALSSAFSTKEIMYVDYLIIVIRIRSPLSIIGHRLTACVDQEVDFKSLIRCQLTM